MSGFTIIEALIAMAILSVSLVIILQNFSSATKSVSITKNYILATLSAESLIDRVGNDIPLLVGTKEGLTNLKYEWKIKITPHSNNPSDPISLLNVKVEVFWLDGYNRQNITLNTVKIYML